MSHVNLRNDNVTCFYRLILPLSYVDYYHVPCHYMYLFLPYITVAKAHVALLNLRNCHVALSILGSKDHRGRWCGSLGTWREGTGDQGLNQASQTTPPSLPPPPPPPPNLPPLSPLTPPYRQPHLRPGIHVRLRAVGVLE